MNSFEGITIEDLKYSVQDVYSGVKTRLYYAPTSYFSKITLPNTGSFEELSVVLEDDLVFRTDKGWSVIDCLIDENEINTSLAGSIRKMKLTSDLKIFLLGLKSHIIGFISEHKDTSFVFMIIDSNGQSWLIGNLRNPAKIEAATGSTGKNYEDNSGFSINISSKSMLYRYGGEIQRNESSGRLGFYDITHL